MKINKSVLRSEEEKKNHTQKFMSNYTTYCVAIIRKTALQYYLNYLLHNVHCNSFKTI